MLLILDLFIFLSYNDTQQKIMTYSEVKEMTESNAKIIKIVLALLAVVSVVLIVIFAVGIGNDSANVDDDYSDEYVEDNSYDPMEDYQFSDDDLYVDASATDASATDISGSDI